MAGWVQFEDGEIYVVNYILDDAPKAQIRGYALQVQDFLLRPKAEHRRYRDEAALSTTRHESLEIIKARGFEGVEICLENADMAPDTDAGEDPGRA